MEADLRERHHRARQRGGAPRASGCVDVAAWAWPSSSPLAGAVRVGGCRFNNELVMPLSEFLALPIVHDLLHNGATFQVLGLTNNTVAGAEGASPQRATLLRACARAGGAPAEALAAAALERLREELDVVLVKARWPPPVFYPLSVLSMQFYCQQAVLMLEFILCRSGWRTRFAW